MTHQIPSGEVSPDVPRPPSTRTAAALRKKKARQRLLIIVIALFAIAGIYWYFQKFFSLPLERLVPFVSSVGTSIASDAQQGFSAPSPLVAVEKTSPKKANTLTIEGVIAATNQQRLENGNLPPLTESATLDDIALLRMDDMFNQQYFAHVGPENESAITVASSVGYSYLALGENLALGLYTGDPGVVNAWMNSPGHRANILDSHYTQIGVAVREGMFQCQDTWIAIQVFGRPASDCPSPDSDLKTGLDAAENQITAMSTQLQEDKTAIDAMNPQSGPAYNEQVENYNNIAAEYNALSSQTTGMINEYDSEVEAFNACLGN
jgi:uncharacterized protein YkwD